jgi:hypothetical protein
MADYTIAVSWSGKDALADSDANKVISGADFNTEFTTVQTAVNSKANTASPTLTGTPAAPTASVATDTTQLATTAFVKDVLENYIYPVGSIYFNMAVSTNPGTLLGFGSWAAYAEGRVLVGFQSSGTFDALDESLGAETAAHTLTTSEIPAHTHTYDRQNTTTDALSIHDITRTTGGNSSATSGSTGGGSAHSHSTLQPSVTVHMWKRTA